MTYSMIVGKYKLIFSDTHFKDFRKKPTISVYDADTNSETKIASFNSQETFEWFIEAVVTADRKTENSSEKPNNCEELQDWKDRMWAEAIVTEPTISKMEQVDEPMKTTDYCDICKRDMCEICVADATNPYCVPSHYEINYEPKDEPQTDCGDFADRLAYERGVKHAWEVAQKVFNSTVTFYEAEDVAKQIDKDINVRSKDEPQTDTEIAKAIVHKMIDDAVIAEDAYPDLRQKMHDAVDEYEPQADTDLKEVCREEDAEFTDRLIEEQLANKLLTDCAWK